MASSTEVCNIALAHLGSGKSIASMTERSQEAMACKQFFEIARDATLRDFPWPFATKIDALALIAEDPNADWAFSYRYPTDCLKIRRILSGVRNDTPDTRVPYKIANASSGQVLFTDQPNAQIEYTLRVEDPQQYPPDFVMAFSLRLAAYIAPRVTGGDAFKLSERALRLYQLEISSAQATATNEEQGDTTPDSEFIRARG